MGARAAAPLESVHSMGQQGDAEAPLTVRPTDQSIDSIGRPLVGTLETVVQETYIMSSHQSPSEHINNEAHNAGGGCTAMSQHMHGGHS